MKKIRLLMVAMIFGGACAMQAQTDNDKEITVTDAQGNQEVIDLPEGMSYELDSLLHQYNAKNYLQPDPTGTTAMSILCLTRRCT